MSLTKKILITICITFVYSLIAGGIFAAIGNSIGVPYFVAIVVGYIIIPMFTRETKVENKPAETDDKVE